MYTYVKLIKFYTLNMCNLLYLSHTLIKLNREQIDLHKYPIYILKGSNVAGEEVS